MASPYLIVASGSITPATGANYSTGSAPANGDNATYGNSSGTIDTTLAGLTGVTVANLYVPLTFTGTAGTYAAGVTTYFKLGATNAIFGQPSNSGIASAGGGRWAHDFESSAVNGLVIATGSSVDTGLEPLRIKCNNALAVWNVIRSSRVCFANSQPGETSTIGAINVAGSAQVTIGGGVTLTTLNTSGGSTTIKGAVTAIVHQGGTLNTEYGSYILPSLGVAATCNLKHRQASSTVTATSASGVATIAHTAHGLSTADYVNISGATQTQYNGLFQITKIDANSYSYAIQGAPASPATGTLTEEPVSIRTLNLYEGGILNLRDNATDLIVNQINVYGNATIKRNIGNPNQLKPGAVTYYDGDLTFGS